jgi:hypothetical protein
MMALAGDHVQVLVDGYDLTGDHNKIVIEDKRKMHVIEAFGDAVEKCIPGQRQPKLQHSGYFNPESGRSHPVLNGVIVTGVVSVLVGQNADPSVGDPMYNLLTQQEMYQTNAQFGEVLPFSANFNPRSGLNSGWGVALAVPVSFTNTTNGGSVDNGSASNDGGLAFLHILQAAGTDTYSIVVEGSTTGAFGGEETIVGTFTLDASAIGSEQLVLTGTIPRYLRFKATRTGSAGDTVRLAVAVMRY